MITLKEKLAHYKVIVLGMCSTGKTALINRLVNNNFSKSYIPNYEVRDFNYIHDFTEELKRQFSMDSDLDNPALVHFLFKDCFGFDNLILQTKEESIKSNIILERKREMSNSLKELILSSKEFSQSNSTRIRGIVYIFVCDINSSQVTLANYETIIESIIQIEKNQKIKSKKFLLLNKIDELFPFRKGNPLMERLLKFREKVDIPYFEVSAKTGEGVKKAFDSIFNQVYMQDIQPSNDILPANLSNEESPDINKQCDISCGRGFFSCGR